MRIILASISVIAFAACASSVNAPPAATASGAATPPAQIGAPVLHVSNALEHLSIACLRAESSEPNALDDDCDGHIDALPATSALSIAWAAPNNRELTLEVVDAAGTPLVPSTEHLSPACAGDGVATSFKTFATLPHGTTRVVLTEQRACEPDTSHAATVALVTAGSAHSYVVTLAPGKPAELASIDSP
jgi:hypothetical protein